MGVVLVLTWSGLKMAGQESSGQETTPAVLPAAQSQAPAAGAPTLIPRSHAERERVYRGEHRILLNVVVTDAQGSPAAGLKEEDFALLDDEQPRKIASFRAARGSSARERVHVILVLDAVNNTSRNIGFDRRGVEKFLEENRGKIAYPISMVLVSASGTRVEPPSTDSDVLLSELREFTRGLQVIDCADEVNGSLQQFTAAVFGPEGLAARDQGSKQGRLAACLNRRYLISVSALNRLAKQQIDVPGRAILIWLGAGWPLLSGPLFVADTESLKRNNFDYLVDLSSSLREAQVTLDAVSSPDLFRVQEAGAEKLATYAQPTRDEATAANFALPALTRQTGGRVLDQSKDLAGEIAASIADADQYYVLSFDSAAAEGSGEYHPLEVKVRRPGMTARTNAAYFALP